MNIPLIKRGITATAVAVALLNPFKTLASELSASDRTVTYPYRTALIASGALASAWALSSGSIANDKKKHFGISVLLGAGSETILRRHPYTASHRWRRIGIATALATAPGFIKELTDSKFDSGDLLADIAGSFTGAMVSDLLQGPTQEQLSVDISVVIKSDRISLGLVRHF
ncbi:MAG: hypothetical protein ACR2PT_11140 [Endozoicomonas sp.]